MSDTVKRYTYRDLYAMPISQHPQSLVDAADYQAVAVDLASANHDADMMAMRIKELEAENARLTEVALSRWKTIQAHQAIEDTLEATIRRELCDENKDIAEAEQRAARAEAELREAVEFLRRWHELDYEECEFNDTASVGIDLHDFDAARDGLDDFLARRNKEGQ